MYKRLTLKALITTSKNRENQQAFKVMQAYAEYFAGQTELALLSLLGLFDHPIDIEVLRVLWEAQITELTAGIDEGDWWEAIESLRHEYQLLAERVGGEELDCHPLIREYFGKRLEEGQPEAWRQAHTRLYEYYKNLPEKEFPDTLEEMQPLFHAVAHGCRAGLYQETLDEVYWSRVQRKQHNYAARKLGLLHFELNIMSHFFVKTWVLPQEVISTFWKAKLLNDVAFRLRGLGYLAESVEPFEQALIYLSTLKNWKGLSRVADNLSRLFLNLGDVKASIIYGKQSVDFSDKSEDWKQQVVSRSNYADAFLKSGDFNSASNLFLEAENIQCKYQPQYPRLYGLGGFNYCDLLFSQGNEKDVFLRAEYDLDCWDNHFTNGGLVEKALSRLTFGVVYIFRWESSLAQSFIEQALDFLHESKRSDHLPLGLLARAQLYRNTQNYPKARTDLQEVYDIAEPSGMRLHLTDYHLEMARLLIAEGKEPLNKIQEHVDKAAKLINDTGYHRRDKELAELIKLL